MFKNCNEPFSMYRRAASRSKRVLKDISNWLCSFIYKINNCRVMIFGEWYWMNHYHVSYISYLDCMLLSCRVRVSEWIHTLFLPKCQGTPCSKQARYLKFKWQQRDLNPQSLSSALRVYGFEFRCCHISCLVCVVIIPEVDLTMKV